MRSRSLQYAGLVLHGSAVIAQNVIKPIVPSAGTSYFPACAVGCSILLQVQESCNTTGTTQLAFEVCFTTSTTLSPLYGFTDVICATECPRQSDRDLLQNWYGTLRQIVGDGEDPLTQLPYDQSSTGLATGVNSAVISLNSKTSSIAHTTATSSTAGTRTATNSAATASSTVSSSDASDGALSLGAKIGIGIAIPLVVIAGVLAGIYCLRRRRRSQKEKGSGTSLPQEGKPEMYAGPVNTTIAGPVKKKSEMPISETTPLPPELHDTTIAEADPNAWKPKKGKSQRALVPASSTSDSQSDSKKALMPIDSDADFATRATTTQSIEAELVEEADAAVQELGLLAMRKKTLVTQANALDRRPEDVEGRKGDEYRELVVREEKVRKRLEDIEAERGA